MRWNRFHALYDPDPEVHRTRAAAIGLDVPADVLQQLFHEPHPDSLFASVIGAIDWSPVRWQALELSGATLTEVHVPREFVHAVEEARAAVVATGLEDERAEVVSHWRQHSSWLRAPLLVGGAVVGRTLAYKLLVGFARLGNLLGLMDRGELPAAARHRVWIGEV